MRNVALAHVVVKIEFADGCFYLLHKNKKWGDWSLVGGHVEPGEEGEWVRTAYRETEEEMPPLQHKKDFLLVPLLTEPITWGPRRSKSAGGQPTTYRANFFRLIFRRDPVEFLRRLGDDFTLVAESEVEHRNDVGELVATLSSRLPHGIAAVPPAWRLPIPANDVTKTSPKRPSAHAAVS